MKNFGDHFANGACKSEPMYRHTWRPVEGQSHNTEVLAEQRSNYSTRANSFELLSIAVVANTGILRCMDNVPTLGSAKRPCCSTMAGRSKAWPPH